MKKTLLRYGITTLVGLLLAFFASGVIIACVGLLVVATEGGAFDMLAYAVVLIFDGLRKDVTKRKYKDFYEYKQAKKEKKRSFAYLLIVGLIFIVISLVFLIPYYNL